MAMAMVMAVEIAMGFVYRFHGDCTTSTVRQDEERTSTSRSETTEEVDAVGIISFIGMNSTSETKDADTSTNVGQIAHHQLSRMARHCRGRHTRDFAVRELLYTALRVDAQ